MSIMATCFNNLIRSISLLYFYITYYGILQRLQIYHWNINCGNKKCKQHPFLRVPVSSDNNRDEKQATGNLRHSEGQTENINKDDNEGNTDDNIKPATENFRDAGFLGSYHRVSAFFNNISCIHLIHLFHEGNP